MSDEKKSLPTLGTALIPTSVDFGGLSKQSSNDVSWPWTKAAARLSDNQATTKVTNIDLAAVAEVNRIAERYGDAGKAGWSPLPDVLLFNQHKLGLNSEELNVVLNMLAHYYVPGAMPFVRPNVIAKRMGVSTRSVQRSIAGLRKKHLINKAKGPNRQVVHDLSPLLDRLQPMARDRIADKAARRQAALTEQNNRFLLNEG